MVSAAQMVRERAVRYVVRILVEFKPMWRVSSVRQVVNVGELILFDKVCMEHLEYRWKARLAMRCIDRYIQAA